MVKKCWREWFGELRKWSKNPELFFFIIFLGNGLENGLGNGEEILEGDENTRIFFFKLFTGIGYGMV